MKIDFDKFHYPEIDRVTHSDGTRFYTCPQTGTPLASVTTIISASSDKSFLIEWEKRVGKQQAEIERKTGTTIGTLLHENLENHILGRDRPMGSHPLRKLAYRMADKVINDTFPRIDEVWGIETPLYYPELFAGTTDLVGVFDGIPSIIDHKNAKRMRKREDIVDYRDQLAAYKICHDYIYGTDIKQGVILMVDRDLNHETYIYGEDELQQGVESFLNRIDVYLGKTLTEQSCS